MKNRYSYIAIFNAADDGISIEFPDLPGCLPCADNLDEAVKNAREALGLHLWGMERDNDPIPEPTPLKDIHCEENEIAAVIDVFMPAFRDKINNRFVKKTLSLPAWLADMADADGVNCSKVFQTALMDYLGVKQA
ncbi:MAG: type II toxin-antitoxin system HicB family antitoxin [Clostridia bacterium]|nr:type II toxin-antitoxin system HicB family antitoxin [Clostridia bacterium]